ncbi:hypothetical protein Agub_g3572 [Astrephomene gubernaculifera]|uniref:NYN domain-containing protein n=1 Tax=Astrephomene gubernaculifera TaxID=47775 RepID=A0AAD3HJ99_9CHLO|nr:hypothetical protein Agub_g3572 [Astrephomene gubernaculifera]
MAASSLPVNLSPLEKLIEEDRDGRGREQKEVLIVWDIENARIPVDVSASEVEKAISNAFQRYPRRKLSAFLAAISRQSLNAMETCYGSDQVNHLLDHTKLLLASGQSNSTDKKLIQEVDTFISRQSQEGRAATSVLVVITGDGGFIECIKAAMRAGMEVEVLHPTAITSRELINTISGRAHVWHHDWLRFLEYWLRKRSHVPGLPPVLELPQQRGAAGSNSGAAGGSGGERGGGEGSNGRAQANHRNTTSRNGGTPPADGAASRGGAAAATSGAPSSPGNKPATAPMSAAPATFEAGALQLLFSSLSVVKEMGPKDNRAAVGDALGRWLLLESETNSALYQKMEAIKPCASIGISCRPHSTKDNSCKLIMASDRIGVSYDGRSADASSIMRTALDRLYFLIEETLEVMVDKYKAASSSNNNGRNTATSKRHLSPAERLEQFFSNPIQQLRPWSARIDHYGFPHICLPNAQLLSFLNLQGVDVSRIPPNSGSVLREVVGAILMAEFRTGLPYLVHLACGRRLVATAPLPSQWSAEAVKAVEDMLVKRLSVRQLKLMQQGYLATASEPAAGVPRGPEKRDLAEAVVKLIAEGLSIAG